jgi:hypothetical protein
MNVVYDIHNEFGRFFDETVYKRELADRMPGMELELPSRAGKKMCGKK